MSDNESPSAKEVAQIRRKHPCVLCQQRKVKCDRNDPCANCTKARVECVAASSVPPKRRKKRFPEAELLARLRKYEAHLRNYGADVDAINREEAPPPLKEPVHHPKVTMQQLEAGCRSLSVRRSLKHVENNFWSGVNEEFRDAEELLQGSSEDEMFNDPITKTYDEIAGDPDDLLFAAPSVEDMASLHPQPVHIFRLWQTFLDNVNPLLKLFHAPTVQQQVLDASADLSKVSKSMHVLMFGIYSMAISSLNFDECKAMFGEDKKPLLKRYQNGCRQALIRASFLRTSDMEILQGYTLYLHSALNFTVDPRALFCLTGIAIRIGQRMGLNFDGTTYALPPFETEMRRRLWWQIVFLDSRVGELSGSGPSMLQHLRTSHLPLNVNDSDLFPDMREPPAEHPGATEMLFVLPRCEVGKFLLKHKSMCAPMGVVDIPSAAMEAFEESLTSKYLKYCDPQIPVHKIAILNTQAQLLRAQLGGRQPASYLRPLVISDTEKEKIFTLSLDVIEIHQAMTTDPILSKFHWMIFKNFPFPAHVYLLVALRTRTTGPLSDRAWEALIESGRIRAGSNFTKWHQKSHEVSTIQLAMANLTMKAWEARELVRAPYVTEIPAVIRDLMVLLQRKREERGSTTEESSPNSLALDSMGGGNGMDEGIWGTGWQGGDQNMGMGMGMGIGSGGGMVGMDMGFGNEALGGMGEMGMGMGMVGVVGGRGNEDPDFAVYGDFMTGFEGMPGAIGTKQFVSGENDW